MLRDSSSAVRAPYSFGYKEVGRFESTLSHQNGRLAYVVMQPSMEVN